MGKKFKVLKDNKEKPGWDFTDSKFCESVEMLHLPTGDYTVEGCEETFIIERKRSTGELAININQPRFQRELERLENFKNPFIICEFTWDDVYSFPVNSGIPKDKWHELKVTQKYLLSTILEYQMKYKTKIILAGDNAKDIASYLFYKAVNDGNFNQRRK